MMASFLLNPQDLIKLLLSVGVGGVLGAEREYRSKSAGFRTLILISLGATIFTILSVRLGGAGNPDRIASNILTGIGFLGAGVIFKEDNKVSGLTTAVTIWVVSALGMCIGLGAYALGVLGAFVGLSVLYGFAYIQAWIDDRSQVRTYSISFSPQAAIDREYVPIAARCQLKTIDFRVNKTAGFTLLKWSVRGSKASQHEFAAYLLQDARITEFYY